MARLNGGDTRSGEIEWLALQLPNGGPVRRLSSMFSQPMVVSTLFTPLLWSEDRSSSAIRNGVIVSRARYARLPRKVQLLRSHARGLHTGATRGCHHSSKLWLAQAVYRDARCVGHHRQVVGGLPAREGGPLSGSSAQGSCAQPCAHAVDDGIQASLAGQGQARPCQRQQKHSAHAGQRTTVVVVIRQQQPQAPEPQVCSRRTRRPRNGWCRCAHEPVGGSTAARERRLVHILECVAQRDHLR